MKNLNGLNGSFILLFTSPPNSERVVHGLEVARRSSEQGKDVTIVLMQDSVFLALKMSHLSQGFDRVSEIYALDEHLGRRGYTAESLGSRIKIIGYEGLVELIMRDRSSVIGSF